MERPSVEVRVGGQTYRVVATASADELRRLAGIVDGKLKDLSLSAAFHPQSMLLVAMTLAHELEHERALRKESEARSRDALRSLLDRVDAAIELIDDEPPAAVEPAPAPGP
ncbi:MAG TPA: cell division protein ZapA [Polyangiaceae bacterium]|nr:cell division protein ZapA [Polyangiaceae bacterium]